MSPKYLLMIKLVLHTVNEFIPYNLYLFSCSQSVIDDWNFVSLIRAIGSLQPVYHLFHKIQFLYVFQFHIMNHNYRALNRHILYQK